MSRLVILPLADLDLEEHAAFIGIDSTSASARFQQTTQSIFNDLLRMPMLGSIRKFRNPRLKELRALSMPGFENYLIFYRSIPDGIEIVRVLHGARDIEVILKEPLSENEQI